MLSFITVAIIMVSLHRIKTLTKTILNISVLQFNFSCLYMQTSCTSLNSELGNSCETMVWIQWPPQSPWLEGRAMVWTGSDHLVSWLQTWVLFYDGQAGIVYAPAIISEANMGYARRQENKFYSPQYVHMITGSTRGWQHYPDFL